MNASSPRSRSRSVSHPSPIVAVEQLAQAGVGQREEATRRDAVGLVGEPLRPHLVEVLEDTLLEKFGVQRGDAVDRVAADGGQVGHPHALAAVLADDRHPPHPVLVAGELCADLVEEPAVDLVDDLEVTGKHSPNIAERPLLQRFRQQRVVGVAEGGHRDRPRLVPVQPTLVDQQPHEFGDADRRMGVVELQRESLGKVVHRCVGEIIHDVQHVLQRARHEEVLLQQPKLLARLELVVRVQHLRDCLRGDLVLDGLVVVAGVERLQCERLHGARAPQRQHVARVDAVALNRGVVGDALDDPTGNPPDALVACIVGVELGVTAPVDRVMHVGLGDLPRVTVGQPVVGLLDLPAVVDLLVEDAELVADAVADGGRSSVASESR